MRFSTVSLPEVQKKRGADVEFQVVCVVDPALTANEV